MFNVKKNKTHIIEEFLQKKPKELKNFIRKSMDIASQISVILKKKNLTQKHLAILLNKKESEISKWLSGTHNFEIKTIAKIESVLEENIIQVPMFYVDWPNEFENLAIGQISNLDWQNILSIIEEKKFIKLSSNDSVKFSSGILHPTDYQTYETIN
ncbi:MAG: helix-turn-helix transcriptional regulator [Bacteroidetes bacterium]|nr:helix-turn-helix transcriptional regulator [Bacteroidota bacterium]